MATDWFYKSGGTESGPITFSQLKEAIQRGELSENDDVRCGIWGGWVVAASVPGLFVQPDDPPSGDAATESEALPRSHEEEITEKADGSCWFFQIHGSERGPVSLRDLQVLARKGDLSADDMVRSGNKDKWISASEAPELQSALKFNADTSEQRGTDAVEQSADEASAEIESVLPASPSRPLEKSRSRSSSASGTPEKSSPDQSYSARIQRRDAIIRKVKFYSIVATVMGIFLTANLIVLWPRAQDREQEYYEQFIALWENINQKREQEISDELWNEFAAIEQQKLEPMLSDLERSATATNQSKQHLLWAGRDYLLPMLLQNGVGDETNLRRHMAEAKQRLEQKNGVRVRNLPEFKVVIQTTETAASHILSTKEDKALPQSKPE